MAFNVSYVFQAIDKFSDVAENISKQLFSIRAATRLVSRDLESNAETVKSVGKKMGLVVTTPLTAIAGLSLHAAAEQEKLSFQMGKLIGNAEKAKMLGEQLEKIKMTAPIDVSNLDDAAVRLLTMGTSVDKVAGILDSFSKIAASTGESLDNLVEMFAVAQSGPEGMSRALMMMNRKIPIIAELQKMIKDKTGVDVTSKQVREMAINGQISMEALQKGLQNLTSEGGKFFTTFGDKSKTLTGAIQRLKNNFVRLQESIGFAIMQSIDITGTVDKFNIKIKEAVSYVEEFAKKNPELTKMIVIFSMVAAAVGPVLVGLGSAMNAIAGLGRAIYFLMSPVGIMVAAGLALAAALTFLYFKFEWIRDIIDAVVGFVWKLITTFPVLTSVVVLAMAPFMLAGKTMLFFNMVIGIVRGSMALFAVLMQGLPAIIGLVRTAMIMLDVALTANPIGIIVAAVAALVAGLVYLINKFGLLEGILKTIKGWADEVGQAFRDMFNFDFSGKIDSLKNSVSQMAGNIKDKISGFFGGNSPANMNVPPLPSIPGMAPIVNDNMSLGAQTLKTESQSSVDINLKGNTAAIESVKSKTDGKTNLAVVQNMAITY